MGVREGGKGCLWGKGVREEGNGKGKRGGGNEKGKKGGK